MKLIAATAAGEWRRPAGRWPLARSLVAGTRNPNLSYDCRGRRAPAGGMLAGAGLTVAGARARSALPTLPTWPCPPVISRDSREAQAGGAPPRRQLCSAAQDVRTSGSSVPDAKAGEARALGPELESVEHTSASRYLPALGVVMRRNGLVPVEASYIVRRLPDR